MAPKRKCPKQGCKSANTYVDDPRIRFCYECGSELVELTRNVIGVGIHFSISFLKISARAADDRGMKR